MRGTRSETGLVVALLFAVGVLANVVAEQHGGRIDLTQDARHTLSPVTQKLLAAAESPIEFHGFLPSRVQAPYSTIIGALEDTLDAYREAAPGRVRIRIIDSTDPDATPVERAANDAEAESYGVEEAELEVAEADRHVRQRVRYGVVIQYQDRRVVVGPVQRTNQIEFALSRALREVIEGPSKPRVIGITAGHGEPDLVGSPLADLLSQSGSIRAVRLDGDPLPRELDTLVILGPRRAFDDRARYLIDQFLMEGKTVIAFLDYRIPSTVFPNILVPATTGLEPLFAHYGFAVDNDQTVLDRTHNVRAPIGRDANGKVLSVHHPLFVEVERLADHPVTRGLGSLAFPLAIPIEVGTGVSVLAQTSTGASLRREVRALDPAPLERAPTGEDAGLETQTSATVAVVYEGEPVSYYADKPRPPAPNSPFAAQKSPERPFVARAQGRARLILATSGTRLLSAHKNGLLFFQNAIDWAVTDTDLSVIRARQAEDRPLAAMDASVRNWVKYGNLVGPSLLLLLVGGVRRLRRRAA